MKEDLHRASGEGMIERSVVPEELKPLLNRIAETFYQDPEIHGINDSVHKLFKDKKDKEGLEMVMLMEKYLVPKGTGDASKIESYLVGEGAGGLRFYLREYLGDEEWEKIELEAAKRTMKHDKVFGGTPG